MRRKKQKHTRRSVNFYKVNHGFREPFKILLDGNFLHATLQANLLHLEELLTGLLGGSCKLFTTPCVSAELKGMGPETAATAAAARRQQLHKCQHTPCLAAAECLLEQVQGGNPSHWWIATQDKALQADLRALPTPTPVLFASANGLHLAEPTTEAKATVAAGHVEDQAVPKHERETEALKDLPQLRPKDESYKKFRRKKTKGPNPLAVKKKKKEGQKREGSGADVGATAAAAVGGGQGRHDAAADANKRKRKKKRLANGSLQLMGDS